jgi:diguanylate cyclase (GGDEF)-like protein
MSITEDDEGFLWLGTNNGVARYWPKTGEIRSFSREDGLHGKLTNAGAAIFSRDGKLFFGGTNGFNRVDPKTIVLDTFEPKVVMTDFHISHESQMPSVDGPLKNTISLAKKITLDRDQSVFSFRFAALNFFALSKVKFAYMLTGIDREWVHVGSDQRFATYSHLSAGNYRFMVRATNADGIWSKHEAVINVAILPSWWETIWFRVTTIVFLILSLFGAYSWRIAFDRRQNEKLERTVEKRTEQLRQAHDKAFYEARVDALTGLTNRRAFTEHSVKYIARGKRNGENFCLAMIDIDFFKKVNDIHGHEGGDKVLKAVAEEMNKTVRETDLVARVGGEEFAVIFEGVPLEMHLVAAERLRKAIESLEISTQGKTVKVTISLGITEWRNGLVKCGQFLINRLQLPQVLGE